MIYPFLMMLCLFILMGFAPAAFAVACFADAYGEIVKGDPRHGCPLMEGVVFTLMAGAIWWGAYSVAVHCLS